MASRAPFFARRTGGVVLQAAPRLHLLSLLSPSLIKRMAQSVVEVMEDSKGKVHENLLANGGRSTKVSSPQALCLSWCPQWELWISRSVRPYHPICGKSHISPPTYHFFAKQEMPLTTGSRVTSKILHMECSHSKVLASHAYGHIFRYPSAVLAVKCA